MLAAEEDDHGAVFGREAGGARVRAGIWKRKFRLVRRILQAAFQERPPGAGIRQRLWKTGRGEQDSQLAVGSENQ